VLIFGKLHLGPKKQHRQARAIYVWRTLCRSGDQVFLRNMHEEVPVSKLDEMKKNGVRSARCRELHRGGIIEICLVAQCSEKNWWRCERRWKGTGRLGPGAIVWKHFCFGQGSGWREGPDGGGRASQGNSQVERIGAKLKSTPSLSYG